MILLTFRVSEQYFTQMLYPDQAESEQYYAQ
jgi:hypothetical protein